MNRLGSSAALLGVASLLLGACGPSGGAASSQAAASSASPAASAAPAALSGTAPSGAIASALPPVPAAPPRPLAPTPAAKRQPTAAELLRDDPAYAAKESKLDALYENAKERDPTGQVEREHAGALAQRRACADRACLDSWFRRREAALRTYVDN